MDKYIGRIIGLNMLVFVAHSCVRFVQQDTLFPIGISILSINLVTAILLITRKSFVFDNDALRKPFWLLSLFLNGALFKIVQPLGNWNTSAQLLFAVVSLLCLGRSFAIAPAQMTPVSKGTYKIVRHPAYLGEMLMALACVWAKATTLSLVLLITLIVSQALRIGVEERLLRQSQQYRTYSKLVKWKLIPLVW